MIRARRLALLALAGLLALGADPASADDESWKIARREFRAAQKDEEWTVRLDAYANLGRYDQAEAVEEIVSALGKEPNPAVVLAAIEAISAFQSPEAKGALASSIRKVRGTRRLYLLMALEKQKGGDGKDLLLEVLGGKDEMAAAQAAIALGKKKVVEAIPQLETLALHKDWQLRAAAARALEALGSHASLPALAKSLAMSEGSERRQIVHALEELTGEKFGADARAWEQLAAGVDGAQIKAKPISIPYAFGIPIYGERVVLILTNSQRNENPHRFGTSERLEALCEVPGARPIRHTRIVTVGHFIHAHVKRCISDMVPGTKFELLVFSMAVNGLFSKLVPASGGNKKVAFAEIDGLTPMAGMNHYDSMNQALDIAGPKDAAAWAKGPDEIIFTACNSPNEGEFKDPSVVAAAIALKARMRMVPIHTIGVETHSYEMMETIATESGGVYRKLYE